MTKRLSLRHISDREADVYTVDYDGRQEYDLRIGRVYRHQDRNKGFSDAMGTDIFLWCARDAYERNHGDQYIDMWSAAKQLALGLGKGEYAQ